jgi:hypothetical protein
VTEQSDQLITIKIRVPKKESSFTYFQLEANEGIAFYSTLPAPKGVDYCDLELNCHHSVRNELRHILKKLEEKFQIIYLEDNER